MPGGDDFFPSSDERDCVEDDPFSDCVEDNLLSSCIDEPDCVEGGIFKCEIATGKFLFFSSVIKKVSAWGGQTRKVPKGGTAFPRSHRKAIFYCEPGAEFSDPTITAKALDWVETLRLELTPYFNGGYVNVLDRRISQYGKQYYGEKNFRTLQDIKKKYDPTNLFKFEQSLPVCK